MSNTTNLDLERPDKGATDWHTSLNSNMTKLDTGYGNNVATIADLPQMYIETGTFNFTTGDTITLPVEVDATNEYNVEVTPTSRAGAIGDIYVTKTTTNFVVKCAENNTTDTFEATIYYIGDIASYGGSIYRRWYVSPDATITDHGDDTEVGSFAWVLDQIGATLATVELPGNKTYTITTATVVPDNVNIILQKGAVFGGAGTLTFDNPEQIDAQPNQQIFGSSITVVFINAGEINPKWYPVTADGITDDTAVFQQMIDGLAADSTILLPDGTIILSNITGVADVKIKGHREGTVLKHKAAASDHMLELSGDIEIIDIKIDGNRANVTDRTIDTLNYDGSGRLYIDNCQFTGTVHSAINFIDIEKLIVKNCEFLDMAEHGGVVGDLTAGIIGVPTVDCEIWIKDNEFIHGTPADVDSAPGGILISGQGGAVVSGLYEGNYFKNIGQRKAGNLIGCIDFYTDCGKSIVTKNRFDNYYYTALKLSNSGQIIVTDNIIENNADASASQAISISYARAYGSNIDDCIVSNNTIRLQGNVLGMYIQGDSGSTYGLGRVNIANNNIYNTTVGIQLRYEVRNAIFSNNIIQKFTDTGVYILDITTLKTTIKISGGIIDQGTETPNTHIYARNNVTNLRLVVEGVTFVGDPATYYISYRNADTLLLMGNDFSGIPATSILDKSTVTNIRAENNYGIQELTGAIATDLVINEHEINSNGGAVTATLADGFFIGQQIVFVMTDSSTSSTLTIAHHLTSDPEVATFNAVDETGVFMWTGTEWVTIYATCTFV